MNHKGAYNYYESPDYREGILGDFHKHWAILIFIIIWAFSVLLLLITEKPDLLASVLFVMYFGILLYIAWTDSEIKGGKTEPVL